MSGITRRQSSSGSPSFGVIQVPDGTNPTATVENDSVTFESSDDSVIIEGDAITNTIDFRVSSSPSFSGKTNVVAGGDFTGTPKTYDVVFDSPYADDEYVIVITGQDARIFTYEDKTQNGFTINANAAEALVGEVSWVTIPISES